MLRRSETHLGRAANYHFQMVRDSLSGRARYEKKIGLKRLYRSLKVQTESRVSGIMSQYQGSVRVMQYHAAAVEQGTSVGNLKKDFVRQRLHFRNHMVSYLAQYEPLSFRSLVELAGSKIPPPKPVSRYLPVLGDNLPDGAATALHAQLEQDVKGLLNEGSKRQGPVKSQLQGAAPEAVLGNWMDAYKEFRPKSS